MKALPCAGQKLHLLKPYSSGEKINCWESFFMHGFQKHNILFDEQPVNDLNPLYVLAQHVAVLHLLLTPSCSLLLTGTPNIHLTGVSPSNKYNFTIVIILNFCYTKNHSLQIKIT